jgi:acyl-CoA dehydrogenase
MVDFQRTPKELELEARTARFVREVVIPYERDPRLSAHGPSDEMLQELRDKARAAGLCAPQVSEEMGGYGLTHRETATVLKAAGYSLLGAQAMNCMAPDEGNMHLLEKVATPWQREHYLRPLAQGNIRSAFLMTEPDGGAGSDPSMLKTHAEPSDGGWSITGRKWLITGARGASFGIVMARTGEHASMFLIDLQGPGVILERVLDTIDTSMPGGHSVLRLEAVQVAKQHVLGEIDQGFKYAQVRLAPARLTHCMRWWGAAQRAHDTAVAYATKRQAFGKTLIDHEGVGFMLADNLMDLHQASLLIDHTAWVLDQGERGTHESSMAKVLCSEALYRVADRSMQVLGGSGVTRDTPVEQIFREIRAFRIYDGPSEVHRWSLAKRIKRGATHEK